MLTDLSIKKQLLPKKRREIPDGKIAGLYLVVQPSGAKSWALRYRIAGKPTKLTIGPYPAVDLGVARRRAQEALGEVASGKDPSGAKKAARQARKAENSTADRVETVAALFVERSAKRKAGPLWAREVARLINVEINPKIGSKRLCEVTRPEIHALLDGIVDRGSPYTANRTLAVLRRMCNWAIERGIIDNSPVEKIKPPGAETARDRVLSDDEVRLVWAAFDALGWPFGNIAKLLLLTGGRRDEIAEARWSELDLAAKTLTIANERSKNGIAHEIPLSDSAVDIFGRLSRIGEETNGPIFTTTGKSPVSGWSRAKAQIDKAIGPIPPWVLHDLRRTAASGMAKIGIAPHVVEAALNHKSGSIKGVAAVYNRYNYATEKRAALDAWARRLDAIVMGSEPTNITSMSSGKGLK
jgi:integrase